MICKKTVSPREQTKSCFKGVCFFILLAVSAALYVRGQEVPDLSIGLNTEEKSPVLVSETPSRIKETGHEVIIDGSLRVLETIFSQEVNFVEISTPATPASNHARVFLRPDGTLAYIRDDGNVVDIATVTIPAATPSVYVKSVLCTVTASSATSVASYVPTNLSCEITPASASNKIKISVTGGVGVTNAAAGGTSSFTIYRGNALLSAANGFTYMRHVDAVNGMRMPLSIVYIDSPLTASATTYTLRFLNDSGVVVTFNDIAGTGVMLLEEVSN